MEKTKILERLKRLEALVEDSESKMRLAVISYKQYQEDLKMVMEELDALEEEIKHIKTRSIFDLWFGNPLKSIEDNFNDQVHSAIEDVYEDSKDNI